MGTATVVAVVDAPCAGRRAALTMRNPLPRGRVRMNQWFDFRL
jgi:hypothetical protein